MDNYYVVCFSLINYGNIIVMGAETYTGQDSLREQYPISDFDVSLKENVLIVDPNILLDTGGEVDVNEAKNLLEGQGGIIEHKNRYGADPSKCPFLGAMGTAGILLAERLESAEQNPSRGKTIIELLAERRQETSMKEQKRPETETTVLDFSDDTVSKSGVLGIESASEEAQSIANHIEAEVFLTKIKVPAEARREVRQKEVIVKNTKKAVPISTWAKKPTKSGHKKIKPLAKTNPKPLQTSVKTIEKILPDKVQKASEAVIRKKPSKTAKKTNPQKAENIPINIKKTTNSVTVKPSIFKEPEQISSSSLDLSATLYEVPQQPNVVHKTTELDATSVNITEDEFAIPQHEVENIEPETEVLYEEGTVENEETWPVLFDADVEEDIDQQAVFDEKKQIKGLVPITRKPETLELQTEDYISKKIDQILEIVSDVSARSLPAQEIRVLFEEIIAHVSLAVGDVLEKDDVIKLVDDFMSQLTQSLEKEYLIPEEATREHKVAITNILAKYTSSLSHIETRFLLIAKYVIHQMLTKKPEQNPVQTFA